MAAAQIEIPGGRTAQLMRLTYPARFRNRKAAEQFVLDNHLRPAAVSLVEVANVWRIVIDTDRAAQITPWLRQRYPGVAWEVSWTPCDVSWTP